jgi:hypothetical protein
MAFALILAGLMLIISSARNTQGDLFDLLKGDFTGPNNFIFWLISILLIGSLGYIPKLKPLSTAFVVLVVVVLVLTKGNPKGKGGGFFEQFTTALNSTQKPTAAAPAKTSTASGPVGGSGLSLGSLPNLSDFMIVN